MLTELLEDDALTTCGPYKWPGDPGDSSDYDAQGFAEDPEALTGLSLTSHAGCYRGL